MISIGDAPAHTHPQIVGLTDPPGHRALSRVFAYGHTFRWVDGDRYVAVMRGNCLDGRRYLVIKDVLEEQSYYETPQPIVDVLPAPVGAPRPHQALVALADKWATARGLRGKGVCPRCRKSQ